MGNRGFKMKGLIPTLCVMAALLGGGGAATAQESHIVVRVVDGRNGKPLANQRLLVFAGNSPETVRGHKENFDLITDKEGVADLRIVSPDMRWIQVWVNFHVLCQSRPNARSFSIAEILSKGVSTPNTCGSPRAQPTPGKFIVFARPTHFWEKMRR